MVSKDEILECHREIRNLSCELEEIYKQIPTIFLKKIIKSRKLISDSARRLIRLANGGNSQDDIDKIRENLNIPAL